MVFGVLLTLFGIGAACAFLYKCAVYALPVAVGLWVGFGTMHLGAGPLGGIVLGFLAGGIAFALGQAVFELTRSNLVRYVVAMAFVVPAAYVGYDAALELSALGISSNIWQHLFAVIGSVAVGSTAFLRLVTPQDQASTRLVA
jgi:hypothetical protein